MEKNIKPIETVYKGCRFRSRLEARWAVFFDEMGIDWEYEPEGFEFIHDGKTVRYLPDFYLPNDRFYVEVKGNVKERYSELEKVKLALDCGLDCNGVLVLDEIPKMEEPQFIWLPCIYRASWVDRYDIRVRHVVLCGEIDTIASFAWTWVSRDSETSFYAFVHSFKQGEFKRAILLDKSFFTYKPDDLHGQQLSDHFDTNLAPVCNALDKARQARFEHGESGGR